MKKYLSFIIVLLFLSICVFFIINKVKRNNMNITNITTDKKHVVLKINETEIVAEIVDTIESRTLGLSGRTSMVEKEGMLFVFDEAGNYPFWMKDMLFSIDIIWLDANKKIVFIKENATPESFPETWGGEVKAKYVLEVISGFVKKHKLKIGDKVEF